jgi:serine/threonine-protein kinase
MLESLGEYKILERMGEGGIGDVYRARDTRLGRTVAIKVARADIADDPKRRSDWLNDARAAARLSHPNIAGLVEVADFENPPYLVFEFAAGDLLSAVVGGRPLNPRRALDYAIQLADALADIHAQGIVHGDLKPDNIVITSKGAAKLLDVGLSRWTAGGEARRRAARKAETLDAATAARTVVYMSPEQALGGAVDHRTDIFSLGTVLVEMLTGHPPFPSEIPAAIPIHIMGSKVPGPSAADQTIPRELDRVVAKMLAKSLDARYSSAALMAADLRQVAGIIGVRSETAEMRDSMPRMQHAERRSMLGWLVALLILGVLGGLIWAAARMP